MTITPADRRVWAALCSTGAHRTIRELARACGYSSSGTVQRHIKRLEAAGIVERVPFKSRAYRVLERYSWVDVS